MHSYMHITSEESYWTADAGFAPCTHACKTEEETTNTHTHLGGELCVLCIGLSWQLLSYGCLSPSEQCNLMTKQRVFVIISLNWLYWLA